MPRLCNISYPKKRNGQARSLQCKKVVVLSMSGSNSRKVRFAVVGFLVILLVLGIVLRSATIRSITNSAFEELENSSLILSRLAAAYYADDAMTNMQFIINLDLTSRVSGVDVLICNADGRIILCSDSPTGCEHQAYHFSQSYLQTVCQSGHLSQVSQLQNIYEETRYVSARPIYEAEGGKAVGFVIVSTPISVSSQLASRVSSFFLVGIAVVTVLTAILMAYVASRQSTPLREMAKTARAFGHGDLDARVHLQGQHPPDIEELALAFNNMASSLQKSEYSRQEFVANVSHELKTPMTTIGGYIDGILDGTIPPQRQRYYMGIVSEETKRMSRLVRSMLDISQLQGEGGIPAEKMSRFDVAECAGQMLITFEQKILSKDLNVDVQMPEHPVYTVANRDYISQVIYNLLDNAVKFCSPEGRLGLSLKVSDSKVLVSISNEGETIPPEELSLLFDRFHKIDKSRTQNRDGWGLGLYIVRTIIGLHGEDISVTSVGGVTEFTFTLPLVN